MEKNDNIALLTELLVDTEKKALDTKMKALEELTTIRKWIVFFGVVTIISLIGGVIVGITLLAQLN